MALTKDCLRFFAQFIETEIGIVYTEVNYYQLESRLEDIAKQLGLNDPVALWEKARNEGISGRLKHLLIDIATNNETSFFRDPNVFNAMRSIIQKAVPLNSPDKPFKIWSAACSTGQELYSLAMVLAEIRDTNYFYYNMLATDISDRVLKRAQDGMYSDLEVQRGLTPAQLNRFFRNEKPVAASEDQFLTWAVKQELKQGISFQKMNLLEPFRNLEQYNLILCRNVLIYQTVENKKKVVQKLFDHMLPGAHLILGGAESLIGLFDTLEYVTIEGAVVYRKKDTRTDTST